MSNNQNQPGPSPANPMEVATQWLDRKRVNFKRLTAHHLKVGPVNFWPGTGTITVDGEVCKRKASIDTR